MTTAAAAEITVIPLGDLAESWYIKLAAEGKSKSTIKSYRASVEGFLKWHAQQGSAAPVLDKATVNVYLADMREQGAKPGTTRLRFAALKLYSQWLAMEGETNRDELVGMRPPKAAKPVVPCLSDEDLDALVKACRGTDFTDKRDMAIVRLLAQTGLRAGEMAALTVTDVDVRGGMLKVVRGKGGKGRLVGFGPVVAQALDKYLRARRSHPLAHTPALWLGDQGKTLGYAGASRAIGIRARAAGITGFHLHRLRHSAASRWLAAGGSEDGAMANFGWTTRDMLSHYTSDTAQRRAIDEARKLGLDRI